MITKITSIQELKQMFLEVFLNKTDKVNDISNESVLNAIAYGCAKVAQKCLVNQSVVEAHLFPDTAYGEYLDEIAKIRGIAPRFGAFGSSTYVRLEAENGTIYDGEQVEFISTSGIPFRLDDDYVRVTENGFAYAKVSSKTQGLNTNVDPLTINKVSPVPDGHIAVTNEYKASGGRDLEEDALFRQRIKESVNQLARGTISYIEQVFKKINPDVLRVHKGGVSADGTLNLIVVSVSGRNFQEYEFLQIVNRSSEYLSLSDVMRSDQKTALKLKNVDWLPIDIDFRIDVADGYDKDEVRKKIQIQTQKLFDYRYWNYGDRVEWENLFFAAKNVDGVRYIPDTHFSPRNDINVPKFRLPRVRGFIMRDLDGNVIDNNNGVLSDFYYPNDVDVSFQKSVISSI